MIESFIYSGRKASLLLLPLFILFFSCVKRSANLKPFGKGDMFTYLVTVDSDNNVIAQDTLTMEIERQGIFAVFGLNRAIWRSSSDPGFRQMRGAALREEGIEEIQMPTALSYLERENIVIASYPTFSSTSGRNTTTESEHSFLKGYGKLSGKKLLQVGRVLDSAVCDYRGTEYTCKMVQGKNSSWIEKFGQYKLVTYYHLELGFVKMVYYYPNGKEITFQLL